MNIGTGNNKGITLVEVLVVASVIGILAVALGFQYYGWQAGYQIESQTKDLYTDIMNARTLAMTRSRMHYIVIYVDDTYQIFEDINDSLTYDPADTPIAGFTTAKTSKYQLNITGSGIIGFDTKGLSDSVTATTINVVIPAPAAGFLAIEPDYDCVMVSQSRVNIGQMSGGSCVRK